jgi:hypothetical protein
MRPVRIWQEEDMMTQGDYEDMLANSLGYTCHADPNRGGGWHKFKQGDVTVWTAARGWVRASRIDDRCRFHQMHQSLGEALKNENGKPFGPDSSPRHYSNCIRFEPVNRLQQLRDTSSREEFVLIACAEGIRSAESANRIWESMK